MVLIIPMKRVDRDIHVVCEQRQVPKSQVDTHVCNIVSIGFLIAQAMFLTGPTKFKSTGLASYKNQLALLGLFLKLYHK